MLARALAPSDAPEVRGAPRADMLPCSTSQGKRARTSSSFTLACSPGVERPDMLVCGV
jgi:hypothetical protein